MYRHKILLLIVAAVCFHSCQKLVEVDTPKDRLVTASVFSSDATANSAMAGVYSDMSTGFANGGPSSISYLCGLSADELTNYTNSASTVQFYTNALTSSNATAVGLWSSIYKDIFAANSILKGLEGSPVTDSLKKEMQGEAKFLRAFCHFYLTNLFGDIPLALTSDYTQNAVAPKNTKQQVYDQIVSDLKDAQNLLRDNFSFSSGERSRPNKIAATALLARVYLYVGDNVNAEAAATTVINTPGYNLLTDLNGVFLKNSQETIWQLMPVVAGGLVQDASLYIFTTKPSIVSLSSQLMGSFENNDARKANWTKAGTTAPIAYYPFKYKATSNNTTEYSMVLRLAEQYLIRAEVRAQQNNISGAQSDLNAIRKRAGLPNTTAADKSSLLTAILKERQVELFTEWGHRWLDLKRTGNVDAVMGGVTPQKGGVWSTNWQLYPIPLTQINNDPAMAGGQNPGY